MKAAEKAGVKASALGGLVTAQAQENAGVRAKAKAQASAGVAAGLSGVSATAQATQAHQKWAARLIRVRVSVCF